MLLPPLDPFHLLGRRISDTEDAQAASLHGHKHSLPVFILLAPAFDVAEVCDNITQFTTIEFEFPVGIDYLDATLGLRLVYEATDVSILSELRTIHVRCLLSNDHIVDAGGPGESRTRCPVLAEDKCIQLHLGPRSTSSAGSQARVYSAVGAAMTVVRLTRSLNDGESRLCVLSENHSLRHCQCLVKQVTEPTHHTWIRSQYRDSNTLFPI